METLGVLVVLFLLDRRCREWATPSSVVMLSWETWPDWVELQAWQETRFRELAWADQPMPDPDEKSTKRAFLDPPSKLADSNNHPKRKRSQTSYAAKSPDQHRPIQQNPPGDSV